MSNFKKCNCECSKKVGIGYIERKGEERLEKNMHPVTMDGNRGRERQHRRWRDEVNELQMR